MIEAQCSRRFIQRLFFLYYIFYLRRYVDDLFLIVPENRIDNVHETFNRFHQNVQFTLEKEQMRTISFLELTIERGMDGCVRVTWYRKPTASLRYVNYYSNHTMAQKLNILKMLNKRLLLFSDKASFNTQKDEMIKILLMNDYPKRIITKYLERELTIPDMNALVPAARDDIDTGQLRTMRYMKIPYIKGLSQQLCRVLKNHRQLMWCSIRHIQSVFYTYRSSE